MRGITVILYDRTETGRDALNCPIYNETPIEVNDVLVAPSSTVEVLDTNNLDGRRSDYTLAIPKGDANDWSAGKRVSFFGRDWRIIKMPQEGIEWLIPLKWNKKVQVEAYEQG